MSTVAAGRGDIDGGHSDSTVLLKVIVEEYVVGTQGVQKSFFPIAPEPENCFVCDSAAKISYQ